MLELFQAMLWPILAAVLLPPALIYFGLQLLERRNPFTALALPQLALLGTAIAGSLNYSDGRSYSCSLASTLLGATAIALASRQPVAPPRDLFTAILFFIAMPITIVLLSRQTESFDEVKHILAGDLLRVNKHAVLSTLRVGLTTAAASVIALRAIPATDRRDFVFYILLAILIGSFSQIGGLLLTFSYLLTVSASARLLVNNPWRRVFTGSILATASTILAIYLAYRFELPASYLIATILALSFILIAAFSRWKNNRVPTEPNLNEPFTR